MDIKWRHVIGSCYLYSRWFPEKWNGCLTHKGNDNCLKQHHATTGKDTVLYNDCWLVLHLGRPLGSDPDVNASSIADTPLDYSCHAMGLSKWYTERLKLPQQCNSNYYRAILTLYIYIYTYIATKSSTFLWNRVINTLCYVLWKRWQTFPTNHNDISVCFTYIVWDMETNLGGVSTRTSTWGLFFLSTALCFVKWRINQTYVTRWLIYRHATRLGNIPFYIYEYKIWYRLNLLAISNHSIHLATHLMNGRTSSTCGPTLF